MEEEAPKISLLPLHPRTKIKIREEQGANQRIWLSPQTRTWVRLIQRSRGRQRRVKQQLKSKKTPLMNNQKTYKRKLETIFRMSPSKMDSSLPPTTPSKTLSSSLPPKKGTRPRRMLNPPKTDSNRITGKFSRTSQSRRWKNSTRRLLTRLLVKAKMTSSPCLKPMIRNKLLQGLKLVKKCKKLKRSKIKRWRARMRSTRRPLKTKITTQVTLPDLLLTELKYIT